MIRREERSCATVEILIRDTIGFGQVERSPDRADNGFRLLVVFVVALDGIARRASAHDRRKLPMRTLTLPFVGDAGHPFALSINEGAGGTTHRMSGVVEYVNN